MNPERQMIDKESKAFIEKAIDALPHKYKLVFMLKEVAGLEIDEISKSIDVSNSKVKKRLYKARNLMQDYLENIKNTPHVFQFEDSRRDRLFKNVMEHLRKLQSEK